MRITVKKTYILTEADFDIEDYIRDQVESGYVELDGREDEMEVEFS